MSAPVPPQPDEQPGEITIRLRRKHLWGLLGLLLGGLIGFGLGRETAEEPRPVVYGTPPGAGSPAMGAAQSDAPVKVATAGRPARGPADAKVTMVEFVDFECPFCGRYARATLPRLWREYGDRIRYVSRHFPLPSHPHAQLAGEAAECAHRMGRYWEFHRVAFDNQDSLDRRSLIAHAAHAGLDRGRFRACLESGDTRAQVRRDLADGRRAGVTGTPTFFIDGRPLRGAQPYSAIKQALDDAIGDGS